MTVVDVGVIGVGNMGKNHARIYSEMKQVDNVFVYDTNDKAVSQLCTKSTLNPCYKLDQLLGSVDAVSICSPTAYHFDSIKKVLAYNIPYLVEKPICKTSDEANTICKATPDGLVCGVGHVERFNPIVNEIKRIVTKPLYINIMRHNPASNRVADSSIVEDLMIHDIDLIFNTLMKKQMKFTHASSGTPDVFSVLLTYPAATVSLSASRKSAKKIRSIYIEEENMTVVGNFMSQELYVYKKPDQYNLEHERYVQENIIEKIVVNKQEPLRTELMTFISCVETERPFPVTINEGTYALSLCEYFKNE